MKIYRKLIEEKVAGYAREHQTDSEGAAMIGVGDILFRYADRTDKFYFFCGAVASVGFGAALPGFCLLFGNMVDSMGAATKGKDGFIDLKDSGLHLAYFSVFVWLTSIL